MNNINNDLVNAQWLWLYCGILAKGYRLFEGEVYAICDGKHSTLPSLFECPDCASLFDN